jgi:hypothetical protein
MRCPRPYSHDAGHWKSLNARRVEKSDAGSAGAQSSQRRCIGVADKNKLKILRRQDLRGLRP